MVFITFSVELLPFEIVTYRRMFLYRSCSFVYVAS